MIARIVDCSQLQLARKLDVTGYNIRVDYRGTGVDYCGAPAHVRSFHNDSPDSGSRLYRHTRDPAREFRDYISLFRMATRSSSPELCLQLDYRMRSPYPLFPTLSPARTCCAPPRDLFRVSLLASHCRSFTLIPLPLAFTPTFIAVPNYSPSPPRILTTRVFDT